MLKNKNILYGKAKKIILIPITIKYTRAIVKNKKIVSPKRLFIQFIYIAISIGGL